MKKDFETAVYKPLKRRFYILFTLCIYSFMCGFIWNAWIPILQSINQLYNWSNTEVNLLNTINVLVFCVLIVPFVIFWNKFGIKLSYTSSSIIILLGCVVRVYPCEYKLQSILVQVGNAISAYGNLMSYVGSTAISSMWFPTNERSRSTCTALAFGALGSVIAPILASQIVPSFNTTNSNNQKLIEFGMQKYLFFHVALALFSLILIIMYFPSKPKYWPCKSSERSLRIDLKSGCQQLVKNKQFWIVFIFNFIQSGVNFGVIAVLPSIIEPLGVSQTEVGILTAVANLCVFVSVIIGGCLGDKFSYKKIAILSIPPTIITYVLFGLQSMKIIRYELEAIYVVVLVMLLVSNIPTNISFEMGCEVSFPISEEVSTAVLGFATNFGSMAILIITMITDKNVNWIPYAYAAAVALMFPLLMLYKDERKRFNCDYGTVENIMIQGVDESVDHVCQEVENDEDMECSLLRFPH